MTKQLTFDLNGNRTGGNRETELTVAATKGGGQKILYVDVPAECQKFDTLCIDFSPITYPAVYYL